MAARPRPLTEGNSALARSRALIESARLISAEGHDLDALLDALAAEVGLLIGTEHVGIHLRAADGERFIRRRVHALARPGTVAAAPGTLFSADRLLLEMIATGRAVVAPDFQVDPRVDEAAKANAPSIAALMAVPLIAGAQTLGVLFALWTERHAPDRQDVEAVEALSRHAGVAIRTHGLIAERARLAGVTLAARTINHEVNNALVEAVGYAELLSINPALTPPLRDLAGRILASAQRASALLQRLNAIDEASDIVEVDWGPNTGSTIELAR